MLPTLNPPPLTTLGIEPKSGLFSTPWTRWFQLLQQIVIGALHPTTLLGRSQSGALYQGDGLPNSSDGNDGDIYFRTDTPGIANQRLYVKVAGLWTGIL